MAVQFPLPPGGTWLTECQGTFPQILNKISGNKRKFAKSSIDINWSTVYQNLMTVYAKTYQSRLPPRGCLATSKRRKAKH